METKGYEPNFSFKKKSLIKRNEEEFFDEAKYLYCIIDCACLHSFGPIGWGRRRVVEGVVEDASHPASHAGDRGDYVYTIPYQDISAVVSDIPPKAIECNPENALTHENVIERVMLEYTVLPMRFGTIFLSEERVFFMLKQCYRQYKENLQRLQNKFEMGLKVLWDEQNIKREIETTTNEAKKLKAEIVRAALEYKNSKTASVRCVPRRLLQTSGRSPSAPSSLRSKEYFLKHQLTKWMEQLEKLTQAELFGTKRKYASFIYEQLAATSFGAVQNPLPHENWILNAAFLIDKEEIENLKTQVEKIAAGLDAKGIEFLTTGPWPPYNFVSLDQR